MLCSRPHAELRDHRPAARRRAGHIILGGNLRIIVPPALSVAEFPIGCSLTVVVHQLSDDHLIAESIKRNKEETIV